MGNTKLLYQISTALVVVVFGIAGLLKVVPGISPETHYEMVSQDGLQSFSSQPLFCRANLIYYHLIPFCVFF